MATHTVKRAEQLSQCARLADQRDTAPDRANMLQCCVLSTHYPIHCLHAHPSPLSPLRHRQARPRVRPAVGCGASRRRRPPLTPPLLLPLLLRCCWCLLHRHAACVPSWAMQLLLLVVVLVLLRATLHRLSWPQKTQGSLRVCWLSLACCTAPAAAAGPSWPWLLAPAPAGVAAGARACGDITPGWLQRGVRTSAQSASLLSPQESTSSQRLT
jgi:hypothetical protein